LNGQILDLSMDPVERYVHQPSTMAPPPVPAPLRSLPSLMRLCAIGGVLVGVLDLLAAVLIGTFTGAPPVRVAQSIASGLLGRAAYDGGWGTAAIGVGLHFGIAFSVASVYVLASRRLPALRTRPLLSGAVYGLGVFVFMYRVVLPLAGLQAWPTHWPGFARGVGAHLLAVGWPIALWTARKDRRQRDTRLRAAATRGRTP
jgi:uncharacterized membrane protein YagU involved in acid resistance